MYIFAVAGNPILHSRSPFLFSAAYNDDGSNYAYFRMHASNADQAMQTFAQLGLKAMNVTAPFKSDILNIVKNCSTTSAILAACNVVLRNNNDIAAHNTDPDGALGALHQANIDINGKTCLVLGAGGAGSAAAYALVKAGGMVTIANRSISKAQDIAHRIGCDFCSLTDISHKLTHSGIIVNTIPVDAIPLHNLTLTNVMLDAVYPNNVLQQKIENAGGIYISGDKWLLHQAMPAYRLFTGKEPNVEAMQKANIPCYPKHISLIGFMGIGKSSMATILAKSLGMQCVDIDSLVEKKYNASISSIIMSMGENYFREIEREILCDALNSHVPSVIACGGGAMIMPESQKILRQNSIVVWLYAPLEQCISNIGNAQTRPLLAHSSNPMLMAQILFQKRIPMYARTAWILINMHGKSIEQGAEIIRQEVIRVI